MLAALHRRLRSRRDDESGIGLIEVLVAASLGLLLMAAVGGAFSSTLKVTGQSVQNRNSIGAASNAMNDINEVIRLATTLTVSGQQAPTPAIAAATATSLTIYSLVDVTSTTNPGPSLVTISNSSGNLVDKRCAGTYSVGFWTFGTCASTVTRTIAGTFVPTTAGQATYTDGSGNKISLPAGSLFTYLDANGNVLPLSTIGGVANTLPSASYGLVGSIVVSVNMAAPGSKTSPVYLQSKTGMTNVGIQTESGNS